MRSLVFAPVVLTVCAAGFLACVGAEFAAVPRNADPADAAIDAPAVPPGTVTLEPATLELAPGESRLVRVRAGEGVSSVGLSVSVGALPGDAGAPKGAISTSTPVVPITAGVEATFEIRASSDAGQQRFSLTATGGGQPVIVPGKVRGRPGEFDVFFGDGGLVDFALPYGSCLVTCTTMADAATILPDGSTLVAGSMYGTTYGTLFLAKLSPEGRFDPSFGERTDAGEQRTGYVRIADAREPKQLVVLADGSIVVAARSPNDAKLFRVTSTGEADPSFAGIDPIAGGLLDTVGTSLTGSSDGLFVSGRVGASVAVVKYLPDGSVDRGFGTNGRALGTPPVGVSPDVDALTMGPEGIVASGTTYDPGAPDPRERMWVGTVTPAGVWSIQTVPVSRMARGLAVRDGWTFVGSFVQIGEEKGTYVTKLLGPTPTPSFGSGGSAVVTREPINSYADVGGIGFDAQGNVLVVTDCFGGVDAAFDVFRLKSSDGARDPGFGVDGRARLAGRSRAFAVAPTHAIVVGADGRDSAFRARVARLWL